MADVAVIGAKTCTRVDVTIVMPCLNEAKWLPVCIANARSALGEMRRQLGFSGEIIVADNGSSDGSQAIAQTLGARVVEIGQRGYGAALLGGLSAASGTYLVMGDADGSYDFREAVAMVRRLAEGADLCIGSRFRGCIAPGAMPWKNRYLGNPVLTFILNLFFRAGVSDAHCGLRALTRGAFDRLELTAHGMEFASELIVKAALRGLTIVEAPATLSRDLRDRPPHLRPWRDGWRHLRYLLMLSPCAFAVPAALAMMLGLTIWIVGGVESLTGPARLSPFGTYWVILAGSLLGLGHIGCLLAAAIHFHGRGHGYRSPPPWESRIADWISLETMLLAGGGVSLAGLAELAFVFVYWSSHHYVAIGNALPAVVGTTLMVLGAQNVLGGFLLAVISDNEAEFRHAGATGGARRREPAATPNPYPVAERMASDRIGA